MQNRLLTRVQFGSAEPNHENLKKNQKKFELRSDDLFPHFRFDFDLIRIKFESFTVQEADS